MIFLTRVLCLFFAVLSVQAQEQSEEKSGYTRTVVAIVSAGVIGMTCLAAYTYLPELIHSSVQEGHQNGGVTPIQSSGLPGSPAVVEQGVYSAGVPVGSADENNSLGGLNTSAAPVACVEEAVGKVIKADSKSVRFSELFDSAEGLLNDLQESTNETRNIFRTEVKTCIDALAGDIKELECVSSVQVTKVLNQRVQEIRGKYNALYPLNGSEPCSSTPSASSSCS